MTKAFNSRLPGGGQSTNDIDEWDAAWGKWDQMFDDMGYRIHSFDPGITVEPKVGNPYKPLTHLTVDLANAMYKVWEDAVCWREVEGTLDDD